MSKVRILSCLTAFSFLTAVPANAADILFAFVQDNGPYVDDGQELAAYLESLSDFSVTTRILDDAVYTDYDSFDQIWVYDLFVGANNNSIQAENYAGIANWFNDRADQDQNLIADGRIISSTSVWYNANGMPSEEQWIQNYALQLDSRGGGLVLGTDHATPGQPTGGFVNGINEINALIDINPFSGFFGDVPGSQALVDDQSPLFIDGLDACRTSPGDPCINDNSTTGFAPAGLQPNGLFLTPVAYHGTTSSAFDNAAVSSTIESPTFTPVPEPTSIIGLAIALLGFGRFVQGKSDH